MKGYGIVGFSLAVVSLVATFPVAILFAEALELTRRAVAIWALGFTLSLLAVGYSSFEGDHPLGTAGTNLGFTAAVIHGVLILILISIT